MGYEIEVTANYQDVMDGWLQFREHLASEVRDRIAEAVFPETDDFSRMSTNKKISALMRELIRGNIPPAIEPQLRKWMELLMLNIHHMHVEQGTVREEGKDMQQAMVQVLDVQEIKRITQSKQFIMPIDNSRREEKEPARVLQISGVTIGSEE